MKSSIKKGTGGFMETTSEGVTKKSFDRWYYGYVIVFAFFIILLALFRKHERRTTHFILGKWDLIKKSDSVINGG